MGIFDYFRRSAPAEEKARSFDDIISALDGSAAYAAAGVAVSESTALQVATVLACVELIARDVASLPLLIKRRKPDGTSENANSAEFDLLNSQPNPWQTAYEFKEQMTAHAVLRGNAYAYKVKVSSGRTAELWPLQPNEVSLVRFGHEVKYSVSAYEGRFNGTFGQDEIFHLRGISWDGLRGLDRLFTGRNSIGLSSALEGQQAQQMRNGSRPSGVLTTEQVLKEEQVRRVADGWREATAGRNAFRTPVLDGGFKFSPVTINAKDSQMVETRKHQMIEVCSSFGVLPAVLGIDDKTQAFASVEAMMRWHLTHTLRPWLVRWEQTIDREVLDKRGPMFAQFDTREFQKASTKERAEAYRTLVELGIMTRNEARELEGLPPIDGGDEPLTPLNMTGGAKEQPQ